MSATLIPKGAYYSAGPTLVDMGLIANGGGRSWTTGVTATTGGQIGALRLRAQLNFIDGVQGAGAGVMLPNLTGGQLIYISNRSTSDITVWAAVNTSDTIIGHGTSETLSAGTTRTYVSVADGWIEWVVTSAIGDAVQVVNVKDFGAVGDGATDDAAAIQAAATAAAGKTLYFPPATYLIGTPIYLSSGTTVQAYGTSIVPATTIASLPGSSNPAIGFAPPGAVMFTNVNWQATTLTDHDIKWFGGTLGRPTGSARLACHGLFLRMVRNVVIADATAQLLNDCFAVLACQNTLMERCFASDFMNCAYDHWDGPMNATVRDCEARGGQSGTSNNGVLFNTDSIMTGHSSGVAANCTVDNVRVYGVDQAFSFGPLIAGPTCSDCTVTNCYSTGGTYGIFMSGVSGGRIVNNVVASCLNPVIIGIVGDAAHVSSQIVVTGNRFENCAATQQYIQAAGPQMTVAHNKAVNCTSGGWALLVDDPTTVIMPNYLPGYNFAFLLNQHPYGGATTPVMEVLADSTHNPGCTISTGSAAPTATTPAGSIYMRTGGASGARLYVSAGGGTWAAVAGV